MSDTFCHLSQEATVCHLAYLFTVCLLPHGNCWGQSGAPVPAAGRELRGPSRGLRALCGERYRVHPSGGAGVRFSDEHALSTGLVFSYVTCGSGPQWSPWQGGPGPAMCLLHRWLLHTSQPLGTLPVRPGPVPCQPGRMTEERGRNAGPRGQRSVLRRCPHGTA